MLWASFNKVGMRLANLMTEDVIPVMIRAN